MLERLEAFLGEGEAKRIGRVRALFPSEKIAIELVEDRLIRSGTVSSEKIAERVAQVFEGTGVKVVNLLAPAPASTKQVLLQARGGAERAVASARGGHPR